MTVYATTTTADKRAEAAARLVEQHLAHRDERIIVGRVTRTGIRVWLVNGHTVTLDPVVTCDCPDRLHRGVTCKHIMAVRMLTTKPVTAPTTAPVGFTADDVTTILRRPRTEPVEEV